MQRGEVLEGGENSQKMKPRFCKAIIEIETGDGVLRPTFSFQMSKRRPPYSHGLQIRKVLGLLDL
jgi:hypothetical protein